MTILSLYWFFGSCFGSHDEAGLLAFEALQAYRGLPEARMAGAPVEEISSKALPAVAKSTPTTAKLMCVFHSAERILFRCIVLKPRIKAACVNSWIHHHGAACGKGFVSERSCRNHACRAGIMLVEPQQSSNNSLCSHPVASNTSQSGITCHKRQER